MRIDAIAAFKLLRPHQWSKNTLVFLPAIAAHSVAEYFWQAFLAFVGMNLLASALYVINDYFDRESDQAHPEKSQRPLASGAVSVPVAMFIAVTLITIALLLAFNVSTYLFGALVVYLVGSLAYTLKLKHIVLVDIYFLAGFYVFRVFVGGVATGIEISPWLLAFCLFLFLNLSVLKRYAELRACENNNQQDVIVRGYRQSNELILVTLGLGAGISSAIILALYVNAQVQAVFYSIPQLIWLLCPLLLYWISHMWLSASNGKMHHDPSWFVFTDKVSINTGIISIAIFFLAI